jgi:hypothetical protein
MAGGITYTHKLATTICREIAEGKSLREICRRKNMPHKGTVFEWACGATEAANKDGFPDMYRRARECQADSFADEVVKIADSTKDPQKARVQIDARKWAAGKQRPKVYGDKINHEHSGGITLTHEQALEALDD